MTAQCIGPMAKDIRDLITELREEEREATARGNDTFSQGACFARVKLEMLLESHGYSRPACVEGEPTVTASPHLLCDSKP